MNEPKKAATRHKIMRYALHFGLHVLVVVLWQGSNYLCNQAGLVDLSGCLKMGPNLSEHFIKLWSGWWITRHGALAIGQVTVEAIFFIRRKTAEDYALEDIYK